jgi:hypothetical protein
VLASACRSGRGTRVVLGIGNKTGSMKAERAGLEAEVGSSLVTEEEAVLLGARGFLWSWCARPWRPWWRQLAGTREDGSTG